MRHTKRLASLAFLGIAASLASAVPVRADGMASYKIVDLGSTFANPAIDPSVPFIDESGNVVGLDGRGRNTGIYQLGSIRDPNPGMQNITLSWYLHANGSDTNLLPTSLQNAANGSPKDFNSSGVVIGFSSGQSYIYSALTDQFINVQWLPGQTQQPALAAINNTGQIVGNGYEPILYSSPSAVPILLSDLLPANSGWKLFTATDINDLGEIVGIGINPSGNSVVYEMMPTATPEPTTLAILVLGAILYGSWRLRSRILQTHPQNEIVFM